MPTSSPFSPGPSSGLGPPPAPTGSSSVFPLPWCDAGGTDAVSRSLSAAADASRRAREHLCDAEPELWRGKASGQFLDTRDLDLARLDRVARAIDDATAAAAAHRAARRELAGALAAGGSGATPGWWG